jgi:hypothetical protein
MIPTRVQERAEDRLFYELWDLLGREPSSAEWKEYLTPERLVKKLEELGDIYGDDTRSEEV